jgi:predicted ArsR family transcriptional regulator
VKSKSGLWRRVLYAARAIVKRKEPLTSASLAGEMGLEVAVASAWLAILSKYGYIIRTGREPSGTGRWHYTWGLTRFGVEYKQGAKQTKPTLRIAANPSNTRGLEGK